MNDARSVGTGFLALFGARNDKRLGFGAMPLSIQDRPPEEQSRKVLHAVIDAGVTFIDTADVYCLDDSDLGHNERLIASVLRERPARDKIRVATKGGLRRPKGAWTNDGRPKHIREACERSLHALETAQPRRADRRAALDSVRSATLVLTAGEIAAIDGAEFSRA